MSRPARSLLVFGCYVLVVGAILLVTPNTLLTLFAFPPTGEVWIRVVGLLALVIGTYYLVAARYEMKPLMRWSIAVRAGVAVCFISFVVFKLAAPALIGFGVVDLAGALWTWNTLAREPAG
jgi:hypothetical protein